MVYPDAIKLCSIFDSSYLPSIPAGIVALINMKPFTPKVVLNQVDLILNFDSFNLNFQLWLQQNPNPLIWLILDWHTTYAQ